MPLGLLYSKAFLKILYLKALFLESSYLEYEEK